MNLSYWEYNSFFSDIDVAIIGSGIVGLSAALRLKEKSPNLNVVIFERGFLPAGASTKNAGFACFGSVSELLADLDKLDESEVFALVEKRWKGLLKLRERVSDNKLSYYNYKGFELFRNQDQKSFESCSQKIATFNKALESITNTKEVYKVVDYKINEFGFSGIEHIIENKLEGQLNTGEMVKSLIQLARENDIQIVNGFEVEKINQLKNQCSIQSKEGILIHAKKVIVATNGFATKLLPDQQVIPARNQVLVTSEIENLKVKGTFHYDEGYIYFRNVGERILLGGARNRDAENETTAEFGLTDKIVDYLAHFLKTVVIPEQDFKIDYQWSGIMGIGNSKEPITKSISNNLFVAVKLGGMGVAIGSLVGDEVADLCLQHL